MARSKYEIKAQKELEAEGYVVDNKAGMGRWAKNRDFFNIFDLVAVRRGEPIRWISIKGLKGAYKSHVDEIREFWLPEGNVKELWSVSRAKSAHWNKKIINH